MSSFIGHSLTGTVICFSAEKTPRMSIAWLMWLIVLAIFPDMEYGVLWLFGIEFTIRFTHSIVWCSILPTCTLLYFTVFSPDKTSKISSIQAYGAAYSHLLLDVLVGVSPLPLLWPFTKTLFTLPFGILPSAGRVALTNRYLYRNLVIELGILVPLYSCVLLKKRINNSKKRLLLIMLHVLIFIPFLVWGISLER